MSLIERWVDKDLASHQEFQSGLARSMVWIISVTYLSLGMYTDYFQVAWEAFFVLYTVYFIAFALVFVSVYHDRRLLRWRRYATLGLDISATTLMIWFTRDSTSPFYLFYIWIFVSYGTRYGKEYLIAASIGGIVAYVGLLTMLEQWSTNPFESFIILLLLLVLPAYQYALVMQLRIARERAERAAESKANFLATMTHELRTPLNGMQGMLELLKGTSMSNEQKEYTGAMTSSSHMLKALINDILDVSKIDADKVELEDQAVDIEDVLVASCRDLSNQAFDKGLELNVQIDSQVPAFVYTDKLRLQQILYNLIGNAVKFTHSGQVLVKLSADTEENHSNIIIEIIDTGIGMDDEELSHVFDQFWQSDGTFSRRYGGTGLGTTIAFNLVKLMGGQIEVSSVKGKGSEFVVHLPLRRKGVSLVANRVCVPEQIHRVLLVNPSLLAREVMLANLLELGMEAIIVDDEVSLDKILASQSFDLAIICDAISDVELNNISTKLLSNSPDIPVIYVGYLQHCLSSDDSQTVSRLLYPSSLTELSKVINDSVGNFDEKIAQDDLKGAFAGKHILIAEDDPISSKLLQTLLVRQGVEVTAVDNGEKALKVASEKAFDMAFIDIRMPVMDGLNFTQQYRKIEVEGKHLPIVALTANAAEEVKRACYDSGMDMYLSKPLDNDVLVRVLRKNLTDK